MHLHTQWNDFYKQPLEKKLGLFFRNEKLYDILYAQQFDRNFLEHLFILADQIRSIAKSRNGKNYLATILSDKRALLFFAQPSTRTFLSFESACHILGMHTSEIRDTSTSSEVIGESTEDMIRTFSSYVDIIITRHFDEGFAELAAWVLNTQANRPVPVVNGGSGKDQHTTQALLDIYTLKRAFSSKAEDIDNKKIIMVGDLKRGRTVRSLSRLLALYNNVEIIFVSPKAFAMNQDTLDFLADKKVKFTVTENLEDHLPHADAIYATRIQDEYDLNNESQNIDCSMYHIEPKHLPLLKENAVILHPFPRRNEISTLIDNDPRAYYWKQARNGMWIRIALLVYLFNREEWVLDFPSIA